MTAVRRVPTKSRKRSAVIDPVEHWRRELCKALGFGDDYWSWPNLIDVVRNETTARLVVSSILGDDIHADERADLAYEAIMGKKRP